MIVKDPGLPLGVRIVYALILASGTLGTQDWSYRMSRRIFQKYRPAYGTKSLLHNGHIDESKNGAPTKKDQ